MTAHRGRFRLTDALHTAEAPPPAALDIIPVSRLTDRAQHFRCEPYHCTMTAGACVDRQARRARVHSAGGSKVRYIECVDCALGREVAARVPAVARTLAANAERKPSPSRLEQQRLRAAGG